MPPSASVTGRIISRSTGDGVAADPQLAGHFRGRVAQRGPYLGDGGAGLASSPSHVASPVPFRTVRGLAGSFVDRQGHRCLLGRGQRPAQPHGRQRAQQHQAAAVDLREPLGEPPGITAAGSRPAARRPAG